jgi:hypothetical protein
MVARGGKFCMVTVYLFELFLHPIFGRGIPLRRPGSGERAMEKFLEKQYEDHIIKSVFD